MTPTHLLIYAGDHETRNGARYVEVRSAQTHRTVAFLRRLERDSIWGCPWTLLGAEAGKPTETVAGTLFLTDLRSALAAASTILFDRGEIGGDR